MIILEPTTYQKSYVTRLVEHVQQRSTLEIVSGQLVILLSMYCL